MATPSAATRRARRLRTNLTDAERTLWRHLRLRQVNGLRFRRQQPIGRFVADFACLERRLLIELDGGQHAERSEEDAGRTAWLEKQGFRVLRFWNNDVLRDPLAVVEAIAAAAEGER
jgi:very-short-patch-repair endonuclease